MATSAIPSCIAQFPLFISHVNTFYFFLPYWCLFANVVTEVNRAGPHCKYTSGRGSESRGTLMMADAWLHSCINWVLAECRAAMWRITVQYVWLQRTFAAGVHGRNAISFRPLSHSPPNPSPCFAAIRSTLPFKRSRARKGRTSTMHRRHAFDMDVTRACKKKKKTNVPLVCYSTARSSRPFQTGGSLTTEWTVNVTVLCELSHCHQQY